MNTFVLFVLSDMCFIISVDGWLNTVIYLYDMMCDTDNVYYAQVRILK